jgi:uncharacterized protein
MKRRHSLIALAACCAWAARAQDTPKPEPKPKPDWQRSALPYITPQAWLLSLERQWYAPQSQAFAQAAARLAGVLQDRCDLPAAQFAWREAMLRWEALTAVPWGPVIERRSQRLLDFQPTRPAAIERAMAEPDVDLAQVGAPAQGLPALEWLLWPRTGPGLPEPACRYARRVAQALAHEAQSLAEAWAAWVERSERDEAAVERDFAALVNQLVGGAEALRWQAIGRPLRASQGQARSPLWPRAASGLTAQSWQARAQALQTLLTMPAQGSAEVGISLEAFLRGRGLNPLADRLTAASSQMQTRVQAASPKAGAARAEQAATALKAVLEDEVAPTLKVAVGFSDADGD